MASETQQDPERIYLEPAPGSPEGRMWCEDDVWQINEGLTGVEYIRADLHAAEIARLSRELEEARERERGLPRTADGVPIVPGMEVWREYLGDRWEAKVVAVHAAAIDIQYTNAANHAAQYHVARGADPTDWHFLSTLQEAGGAD